MSRDKTEDDIDPFVLRVRGLPWSASKDDIVKFFDGCAMKDGPNGIHLTMSREGRPSGEAYVEFETQEDAERGLEKNNEHLGSRYIEVFKTKQNEMEWALRKCGLDGEEAFGDACVRLRGLPFGCSKEEIAQFFSGLEIVRNGITLPTDFQGRSTGEAYVQFANQEIAEKAMGKHKEKIGHRYIEIFKSSLQEIRSSMGMGPMRMKSMGGSNRPSPYDRMDRPGSYGRGGRGGRGRGGPAANDFGDRGGLGGDRIRDTGHNIHMRGLPYRAVERDLFEFFAPLKPIAVRIKYEASGRSSGEADAMFASHEEALRAMKKDKEKMQHRYIELFLQSEPDPFGRDGDMGGPYGGFGRGGRPYMPESEDGFGSNMGPDRGGFGGGMTPERGYGQGSGPSRGFGGGNDRGFNSGGGGGYGSNAGGSGSNRNFGMGSMNTSNRDYGFSSDKSFPQNPMPERNFGGGAGNRSYGSGQQDRSFGASGYGDDGGYDMNDDFRNGMNSGSMQRNDGPYGSDRTNESEFYGSGKLFGENSYSSSGGQAMMSPTTYPGF